ncbi:uncharacterized protein [Lolium perenne]|uniref:uncharacterized protein n=1 Tax=Lolium perenne TaxID=4522 RepID=UPI003A9A3AEE
MSTNQEPGISRTGRFPVGSSDQVPGTHGVDFLDLNEVPFDINEEPGILPPNYFTQLLDEAIDESPQPPVNTHAPVVNVEPAATNTYTGPLVATTDTTTIAQDGNEDEASSQPNDPHVGMRYDTLEGAKEHYNAHAARKGFSVKVNSNRRSTITGEKQKQQFTCNKFRRPRKDDGGVELQVDVGPIPDSVSEDEANIENAELASVVADLAAQGRKEKAPKKRKRENIVHTFCKAQMVVKLIDGRWEVIHFVPEHNHPLIHKPSLTKYLRSHQGMPKEEKEFVKNLHNTNLTAENSLEIYCRDIYLRFRNEFELIGRYNVLPFGCNFYKLEPNRGWCAKYGTRTYLVTANKEEGTYYCECSKMDRDGILCCHILKIFTHLGVDEIPDRYILKRWTQGALSGYVPAAVAEQPDVMPPESQVQLRHANLNMGFTKLARIASRTDATTAIVNKHLRAAATEISHLNKSLKKKKPVSAVPSTSAPDQPTKPRDPAKTTTKGRTKEHRTVSALELHPKKKVQCHTCGSFEHNSATCKQRFL